MFKSSQMGRKIRISSGRGSGGSPYLRKGGVPPEKILAGMAAPGSPAGGPGPGAFSLEQAKNRARGPPQSLSMVPLDPPGSNGKSEGDAVPEIQTRVPSIAILVSA